MWLWWRSSRGSLFLLRKWLDPAFATKTTPLAQPHMWGKGRWADSSWQGCVIQQELTWRSVHISKMMRSLEFAKQWKEVFGCATSWVMMHLESYVFFGEDPISLPKLIHRLVFWPWLLCLPVPLNVYFLHAISSTVKLEDVRVGWLLKSYDVRLPS